MCPDDFDEGLPVESILLVRNDNCGAKIHEASYGHMSEYGWEIDHIKRVAKGGSDKLANLQPLHWENNRHKGDDWRHWTCAKRA